MDKKRQAKILKEHIKTDEQKVSPKCSLKKEKIGYVELEHGLNDEGDYVWHFSPYHRAKPFPENVHILLRIIKTYLLKCIPSETTVDVYPPPSSWDKKVISVLARGLGKKWNFNERGVLTANKEICDHMTEVINANNPRRRNL